MAVLGQGLSAHSAASASALGARVGSSLDTRHPAAVPAVLYHLPHVVGLWTSEQEREKKKGRQAKRAIHHHGGHDAASVSR